MNKERFGKLYEVAKNEYAFINKLYNVSDGTIDIMDKITSLGIIVDDLLEYMDFKTDDEVYKFLNELVNNVGD